MGDVLLATPVITLLNIITTNANIIVITTKASETIMNNLPNVSVVHRQRSLVGAFRVGFNVRRRFGSIDLFVDLQGSLDSEIVSRIFGAKISIQVAGCKSRGIGHFTTEVPLSRSSKRHRIDCNLDVLRRVGIDVEDKHRRINCASLLNETIGLQGIVGQSQDGSYVVIHPTSRWLFKTPSPSFWIELISLIQHGTEHSVLLTGLDTGREGEFLDFVATSTGATNLAGQLNLNELGHLIYCADGFIGVDTFSSHIASALKIPGVVLFGPSDEYSWGPTSQSRLTLVTNNGYACRPCNLDGCGGGKRSECLETLPPQFVFDELIKSMRNAGE